MWIRYVLVSGRTDTPEPIDGPARFVGELPAVQRVDVLPFHKLGAAKYTALGISFASADTPGPSRVELTLERTGRRQFVLRNTGTAVADAVTLTQAGEDGQGRNLPDGVALHPGEGHPFFIVSSAGLDMPTRVYVQWDGGQAPVPLGSLPGEVGKVRQAFSGCAASHCRYAETAVGRVGKMRSRPTASVRP